MKANELFGLVVIGIVMAGGAGWIMNIYKLCTSYESEGMILARAAGIFVPPLGCVLGYM